MSKRFVVLASIGFFIVFAIKACIVLNDFYAMEAKWDVNIKNCTSIENPSVKIIIDGYGVSVSADERRFWGPAGDVEKIEVVRGGFTEDVSDEGAMDESIIDESTEALDEDLEVSDEDDKNVKLKKVYLTFDDGPNGDRTRTLINALEDYKMSATFFMLGSGYATNADLLILRFSSI